MASPGGKGDSGRFDFDAWCRTNRIHDRIVDFLRFQELMTPRLLSRLTDEEKVMLSEEEGVQQRDIARLEAAIDQLFHEGHRKSSAGFSPTHLFALDKLRTYSESSEAQGGIVRTKATTLPDKQHNGSSELRGPAASAFDRDVVVRKTFPPLDNRNRYSLRPEILSKTKGTGSPIVWTEKSARAKGTVTSNGEGRVARTRALFSSSTENTVSSRLKTFEELKTSPTKTPARAEDLNKPEKGRSFVPLRDHVSKGSPT
ncbi:hypothetical protein Bbelb_102510 [Branchiostoma belcheri]|nr:hypothetical protein Bbelb_102510 [Branchiostoma belcheri]